jgi:hypothetical protein
MSLREIEPFVGCSHVTVGKRLRAMRPDPKAPATPKARGSKRASAR